MIEIKKVLIDNMVDDIFEQLPKFIYVTSEFKTNSEDIMGKCHPYIIDGKLYGDLYLTRWKTINPLYPCIACDIDIKNNYAKRLIMLALCKSPNVDISIKPIQLQELVVKDDGQTIITLIQS